MKSIKKVREIKRDFTEQELEEINKLKGHNISEEEFEVFINTEEDAKKDEKVLYKLNKAYNKIQNQKKREEATRDNYMSRPMSRAEASEFFVSNIGFQQIIKPVYNEIHEIKQALASILRALKKKDILTDEEVQEASDELVAKGLPNKCKACIKVVDEKYPCDTEKKKWASDELTGIEPNGEFDKVFECEDYDDGTKVEEDSNMEKVYPVGGENAGE